MVQRYRLNEEAVGYIENYPPAESPALVPASSWAQLLEQRFVFLYHGNILWYHGFLTFVRIFEHIRRRRPEALVFVVGPVKSTLFNMLFSRERQILNDISQLRRRPWQESGIFFTGQWVPKSILRQLALSSQVHISQLDNESTLGDTELRTCLLEAMQWGMACLHCRSSAILEHPCFIDGKNILLIDPHDVEGSAQKILQYMDNPARLKQIGLRARDTIAGEFSFEDWFNLEFLPTVKRLAGTRAKRVERFGVGKLASGLVPESPGRTRKVLVFGSCRLKQLEHIHRSFVGWDVSCLVQREREEEIAHVRWTHVHTFNADRFGLRNVGGALLRTLRSQRFDVVVVPWSNSDGAHYSNVECLALALRARHIVGCTIDGVVRTLSGPGILFRAFRERCSAILDSIADGALFVVVVSCYRLGFNFGRKRPHIVQEFKKAA
jgi:hypothetical protein